MKKERSYLLGLLTGLFLGAPSLLAQSVDPPYTGGPETEDPYSGGYGPTPSGASEEALLTAEDSARFIPSYELYGDFDTEKIFDRVPDAAKDSVCLQLSNQACDHQMPICGYVTSPFGPRHRRMHYGVDLKLERGDQVVSAFEGIVRISRFHKQFGNVVVVRHANGLETLYAHLSQRSVEPGDHVEAGQILGLGGSTGRSTGDHLHFETRYRGQPIDPQLLFDVNEGELRTNILNVHPGLFSAARPARTSNNVAFHVVRRGDTLYSIARKRGTTVKELCRRNRLRTTAKLRVGQKIRF